jgi:tRNA A-37 threonylcarbamoyl transferase component Bud32
MSKATKTPRPKAVTPKGFRDYFGAEVTERKQMLDAIAYVHAEGVLHRDISPDNILLDRKTGRPVLIDFGASRKDVTRKSRALSGLRVVTRTEPGGGCISAKR